MDLQDLLAADEVGVRDDDLTVEAAGPQQCRIEHVGPVGRGDDDDAFVLLEAVHLDEQLVERLFALVVAAAKAGAAMATDRVDFVDEDDAGRVLLRLLEHVAHAACADADEHFDEVGARDGEEGHIGFAGDRTGGQSLAGAWRPDQQHAARDASAQFLELLRVAQELDDLLQVLLGFVDARDVLERHPPLRFRQELGLRLAESHRLAGAALHLPGHVDPETQEQQHGQDAGHDREQPIVAVRRRLGRDRHVLLVKHLHEAGVVRRIGLERSPVLHVAGNLRARDRNVAHVAGVGVGQELAEGDLARRRFLARALEQSHERQNEQKDDHPEGEISIVCVHNLSVTGRSSENSRTLRPRFCHLSAPSRIAKRTQIVSTSSEGRNCCFLAARGGIARRLSPPPRLVR